MTKTPIPIETSKQIDNTKTPPKTSMTQPLRSVVVTSHPTGVVVPVYGYPTFQLTTNTVLSKGQLYIMCNFVIEFTLDNDPRKRGKILILHLCDFSYFV